MINGNVSLRKDTWPFIKTVLWKPADMLQSFSDELLNHALEVADKLTLELFTRLTEDTMKNYMFHGA